MKKILILDGGFGTMLQTYDIENRPACNDQLSVTHPEVVADIHRKYLEAGADIISTNSFNANAISLSEYHLSEQAYDIARAAAEVARKCADEHTTPERPRYVAGSMGPTNRTLSMSADVSRPDARDVDFDQMRAAYLPQARGLIDGGADFILIETVFDTLNAKAAIAAVREVAPEIPLMISATVSDSSGRILTGQTIEAFVASVMHARPYSLGLNCGFGAKHLLPYLRRLAAVADTRISVHPNAGLPNVLGGYDETPEMFAEDMRRFMEERLVNIAGGCCGTTPDHIRLLAQAAKEYEPRPLPEKKHVCTLSGLEPLSLLPQTNFINIGERTNVAGSAKFARLIREEAYDEALSIALAQVQAGAQIVDVCMDDAMIPGVEAMTRFLRLMASEPEIARVPVMIDSSKWPIIEAGLKNVQGKSIVNSISLKEGEEAFLEKARKIMMYGAAAVVMLFDEQGQADTYERKVQVARRAYDLLCGIGFAPEDIIIDPNVLAVGTGIEEHDVYARDFIEATRWIKQNLPGAKVSGGVSNLSFAFRGNNAVRKAMHAVFLYHAIQAGMDMAIVNPQMVVMYDDIESELLQKVEDLILLRRHDASERLAALAKTLSDTAAGASKDAEALQQQWRELPAEGRIEHALLSGDTMHITDDSLEAYRKAGSAVGVIEGILMPAMAKVGSLFADGKMFLPQVVKSARVMKQAVAAIEPYFSSDSNGGESASKSVVVLATVRGDVHDIGKNILSVVLSCNGYQVIDLGVMVPAEKIIEAAKEHKADVICLSGLITPSLDEMIHVAQECDRQGLEIPIVVGGATTSAMHTAVKIAPATHGVVVHSTDAANNAYVLGQLTGTDRAEFISRLRSEQEALRRRYEAGRGYVPTGCPCCSGHHMPAGIKAVDAEVLRPQIPDVAGHINWSFFFAGWGIPGRYPDIFDHPERGQEARKLYADALEMLERMHSCKAVELQGVVKTLKAHTHGDDIVVEYDGHSHTIPLERTASGYCVSDFVEPGGGEVTLFALTAGVGLKEFADKLRGQGDEYSAIMAKLLCDRLVEAFADKVLPGGCRIAVGYPSMPNHALKHDIFAVLGIEERTGMRLSDTAMIIPGESVCGIWLKQGHYEN